MIKGGNMKKILRGKLLFSLLMITFIILTSCGTNNKKVNIESIEVDANTIVNGITLEDFNLSTVKIIINKSDGSFDEIPLDESMLTTTDLALLNTTGIHTIYVRYLGKTTTFSITIKDSQLTIQLKTIYNLALSSGLVTDTYEDWLASIKGNDGISIVNAIVNLEGHLIITLSTNETFDAGLVIGNDGKEVVFQVSGEYIQWKYTGESVWKNLIELATLVGPIGDSGREIQFQVNEGYVQSQYIGDSNWTNLLDLSSLTGTNGLSAYELYKKHNPKYFGTEEEWLASLIGDSGITPHIGINGNWWIGDTDTGTSATSELITDFATDGLIFELTVVGGVVGYEVIAYNGMDNEVFVPNQINGIPVVSTSDLAFMNKSHIEVVYIPDNIRKLGSFQNDSNLREIVFGENSQLTHIPNRTFYNNTKLAEVTIPRSVTNIGDYAFANTRLFKLIIPSSVQTMGIGAFSGAGGEFSSIYCESPSKPTNWNNSWRTQNVHWGVTIQDDYIVNLTDDNTYRIVGYLGNDLVLEFPEVLGNIPVTHIGNNAFGSNPYITGVKLASSITTVETRAFMNVFNLKQAIIPSSVVNIGQYAFNILDNYYGKIYVEAANKETGWDDYWYGYELDSAKVVNWNVSPDDVMINEDFQYINQNNEITITGILKPTSSLIIPDMIDDTLVKTIGRYAFYRDINLNTIQLPEGLVSIHAGAFKHTLYLTDINIPTTVVSIDEYAFEGCYELRTLHIPMSVTTIGQHVFRDSPKLTLSVERSEIAIGWDITWNGIQPVYWNILETIQENGFYGGILSNHTAIILDYRGNYNLIIIPDRILEYDVSEIGMYSIYVNSYGKVVIPSSVVFIDQSGLYSGYESNIYVYSEVSSQPENWDENWISGYSYFHHIYWAGQWSYINGYPIQN